MPKFLVKVRESQEYTYLIEAPDEDAAWEAQPEQYTDENREADHGGDTEVLEVRPA